MQVKNLEARHYIPSKGHRVKTLSSSNKRDKGTSVNNEVEKPNPIRATLTPQRYVCNTNPTNQLIIYNEHLPTVGGSVAPFLKLLEYFPLEDNQFLNMLHHPST